MRFPLSCCGVLFWTMVLWANAIASTNTPAAVTVAPQYFRADHGVAPTTGSLPANLEAAEALRWSTPLDPGHSTPIFGGGKIFLTGWRAASNELATVALDEATGKLLWRQVVVPEHLEQTHDIGSPATATAACDGQRVYVFFGSAGAFCYDLDGHKLWEQRMGPFRDEYGAGSSPILYDGKLILNQDHDLDSFLLALDCMTGRVAWKVPRPEAVRSYSTPAIWTNNGRAELLVAGALQLSAHDPGTGERLWWLNGLARIVIPTPVLDGPMIYMASWAPGGDSGKRILLGTWAAALEKWDTDKDGQLTLEEVKDPEVRDRYYRMDLNEDGRLNQREWERQEAIFRQAQNALLAIKPEGRGELPASAIQWRHTKGIPYVSSPLLANGILWMVKDGGIVTKLEAKSGKVLQEERLPGLGNYFASPIAGDGKVYFAGEAGTVSVLAAETEWRVLSSRNFKETIFASPAIHAGALFVRTEKALYRFQDLKP